jgi:hypothetical protein
MPGRALLACLLVVAASAVPAVADGSVQFTLGRVIHTTPDAGGRIGIRSSCAEPGGCKVNYLILRGTTVLGGIQGLLLNGTVQTDYVTLSKQMAGTLRRRRIKVTISADASNPAGAHVTQTKTVILGPPKKRRR